MMPCFDVADGRLRFRGWVPRRTVTDWMMSEDGAAAVEAAAQRIGFSLFGRARAARRRLRRDLSDAVSLPSVRESIAAASDRYAANYAGLAHAPSLPRAVVALRRIVIVPRALALAHALPGVTARLTPRLRLPDGAERFAGFFARRMLQEMDEAILRHAPSLKRPFPTHEMWACVGFDREPTWVDPLWSGPEWRGHLILFEMPRDRLQRRERRELEAAIESLTQSVAGLSRQQRDDAVRAAADAMRHLRV